MDIKMGEKIKMRRLSLGYSLRDLAEKTGSTASSIRKWENGDIASMKTEKLKLLAGALGVDPLWLMGLAEDPFTIENIEPIPESKAVPILGSIACGEPILAEENREGEAQAPVDADFALRAKGDSMINARILPGDLVFIRRQSDVDSGDIAAVLIDGEATLKRVYKYRRSAEPENPRQGCFLLQHTAVSSGAAATAKFYYYIMYV